MSFQGSGIRISFQLFSPCKPLTLVGGSLSWVELSSICLVDFIMNMFFKGQFLIHKVRWPVTAGVAWLSDEWGGHLTAWEGRSWIKQQKVWISLSWKDLVQWIGLPKPWRDRRDIQSVSPVPSASAAGPSVPSVSNSRRKLTNWFANSHN